MTSPVVSVIMPVYNASRYLEQAIESILDQTRTNLELLVIDDGSTDGSLPIARSFRDSRIRLLSNGTNKGQSSAQNLGLRNAEGAYIALMGADDRAFRERFAIQVQYLESRTDVCMVGSSYYRFHPDETIELVRVPCSPLVVRWRLLFGNPIGAPTVMLRRDILDKAGVFDEAIAFGEDLDLWGRIAAHGKIGQIDVPLTAYRVHPESLSARMPVPQVMHWRREAYRRNVRRLAKLELADPVIMCLAGMVETAPESISEQSYRAIWECAMAFRSSLANFGEDGASLFNTLLEDLLRLARQCEGCRHLALQTAVRYASCFAPDSLLTSQFFKFGARVVAPASMRRQLAALRDRANRTWYGHADGPA